MGSPVSTSTTDGEVVPKLFWRHPSVARSEPSVLVSVVGDRDPGLVHTSVTRTSTILTYTHTYVHVFTYIYVHTHTRVYILFQTHTHTYTCMFIYVFVPFPRVHTHTYTLVHGRTYTHIRPVPSDGSCWEGLTELLGPSGSGRL